MEEVGSGRLGVAARRCQLAVGVGEAKGRVGGAVGEFLQVVADGGNAAAREAEGVRCARYLLAGHLAEHAVELLGELGQAIQADDGKGAVGLVQMGLGELDPAGAIRGGSGFGECLQGPFKGQVDLAFDPGQRTQVEFMC